MNDIMKKNILTIAPIAVPIAFIVVVVAAVASFSIPLEWVNGGFVIIVITYVTLVIISWKHPRVRHYEKALKEFEKDYYYVKEIK
jgi:uncharacterized membrane protein